MTLTEALETVINPALAWLPGKMTSDNARVQMLAQGLQESKWIYRYQVLDDPNKKGPARSFFQMERGGAITNVLNHTSVRDLARKACVFCGVQPTPSEVWHAVENNDLLAGIFARLELWTDPHPLPALGDADGAWALYLRCWRPGKPHPKEWPANYSRSLQLIESINNG